MDFAVDFNFDYYARLELLRCVCDKRPFSLTIHENPLIELTTLSDVYVPPDDGYDIFSYIKTFSKYHKYPDSLFSLYVNHFIKPFYYFAANQFIHDVVYWFIDTTKKELVSLPDFVFKDEIAYKMCLMYLPIYPEIAERNNLTSLVRETLIRLLYYTDYSKDINRKDETTIKKPIINKETGNKELEVDEETKKGLEFMLENIQASKSQGN